MPETATRPSDSMGPYQFGCWTYFADRGDLHDGQTTTRLEPQVAKLLDYFIARQNVVISRDELIQEVWDERVVSDDAIGRCVSILRQTFGAHAKETYIETVRGRGYLAHFPPADRAPVEHVSAGGHRRTRFPTRHRMWLGAVLLLIVCISLYSSMTGTSANPNKPPVVAVLPILSISPVAESLDGESTFFAQGIHDDLVSQLAKLKSLRVISKDSVVEYSDELRGPRDIGADLNADVILTGSLLINGEQIRVNARLIDTKTEEYLWAESYDRALTAANLFEIQSELSRAIARAVHVSLTPPERSALALVPTQNMAAYRAYHRAMQIKTELSYEHPGYRRALEEAVELDPSFAMALAQLVTVQALMNMSGTRPEYTALAEETLQKLYSVAPDSAEYRFAQASYLYYILHDYDRAHDVISQVISMNPSNVDAIQLRSWIERRQGNWEASLQSLKEVRQLNPRSSYSKYALVGRLMAMHRYAEAQRHANKAPPDDYVAQYFGAFLQLREHRDFALFQQSMAAYCQFRDEQDCGWLAHIASRDYPAAARVLQTSEQYAPADLTGTELRMAFTYWITGDDSRIQAVLPAWNARINRAVKENTNYRNNAVYIKAALLAGIAGNKQEAEAFVQRFFEQEPLDAAEQMGLRAEGCRILGMIGRAGAAVDCLRTGLDRPSLVHPFLEPFLPFYDSIRGEPAFIRFLNEIDETRWQANRD